MTLGGMKFGEMVFCELTYIIRRIGIRRNGIRRIIIRRNCIRQIGNGRICIQRNVNIKYCNYLSSEKGRCVAKIDAYIAYLGLFRVAKITTICCFVSLYCWPVHSSTTTCQSLKATPLKNCSILSEMTSVTEKRRIKLISGKMQWIGLA